MATNPSNEIDGEMCFIIYAICFHPLNYLTLCDNFILHASYNVVTINLDEEI